MRYASKLYYYVRSIDSYHGIPLAAIRSLSVADIPYKTLSP